MSAAADADSFDPVDTAVKRIRGVYGGWGRDTPIARMRADWDELFASQGAGTTADGINAGGIETERAVAGGVDSLWVCAGAADVARVLVYFHGGGYTLGSVRSHLDLMARISLAARCRVLGVNYRLAPEHLFPAPLQDAVAVYEWLLAQGLTASSIAFAGDSAGGGLAAAAMLALRERKQPLPAAAVMLSAWTDLSAQGESYVTRAAADPIHQREMLLGTARRYLGPGNARDPLASPLFGDLSGFPPLLLQVGDRETVLDDSTRFADKARAAGAEVQLEVYANMIHVFQQFPGLLREAGQAVDSIGLFLRRVWDRRGFE
jgi:acetyl esterase/lipase